MLLLSSVYVLLANHPRLLGVSLRGDGSMPDDFDNNWAAVRSTPSRAFRQVPFDDVYSRAGSWDTELMGAILRVEDPASGTIREKHYTRMANARQALKRFETKGKSVTLLTAGEMYSTAGFADDDPDDEQ